MQESDTGRSEAASPAMETVEEAAGVAPVAGTSGRPAVLKVGDSTPSGGTIETSLGQSDPARPKETYFPAANGRSYPESREHALDLRLLRSADAETWAQFMLKFVVAHPAVTVATPGTSDPEHMIDNLGGGRGRLPTPDHLLRRHRRPDPR